MAARVAILFSRVRALLFGRRIDADFNQEIDAHLVMLTEAHMRRGLSVDEAARAARLEFGGLTQFKEAQRDRRGFPGLDALLQDLRYAVRQLRQRPGYAIGAILTLALGIGANTAIFSLLNGYLRPLPVRDPAALVTLANQRRDDEAGFRYTFSYPALADLRTRATVFSDIFGFTPWVGGLQANGKVTSFLYSAVTDNYFSTLGLQPALGQWFAPQSAEQPGGSGELVLGYAYWQKRFGADPNVLGTSVRVNGQPATIVGVAPAGFFGLYSGTEMDGYAPLGSLTRVTDGGIPKLFTSREHRPLTVLARLKPGVTLDQAQKVADVIAGQLERENPATDRELKIEVFPERLARPFPQHVLANLIPVITAFVLALAGLVLLLACMNVANLALVQATGRQREMAVRAALGASRLRLVRQTLTESLLLAGLGGAAGLVLGYFGRSAFAAGISTGSDFPLVVNFGFDWRVFTYAFIAVLVTGVAVGVLPAVRASRADASTMLHDAGRSNSGGPARQRTRRLLVVGQVAGSLMLLIVASLFMRRLTQAEHLDLGFDTDRVLNVRIDPVMIGYSKERTKTFFHDLERRVQAWPEAESASLAFSSPMGYFALGDPVLVEGRPAANGVLPPDVLFNCVTPAYFQTMGIPILRGRGFSEADDESAPRVAIVNHTMAERYWPSEDPIGKRFRLTSAGAPLVEVVGVARDGKYMLVFEDTRPYFYMPHAQNFGSLRVLQVRAAAVSPASLASKLEREVHTLDPDMPLADLQTMRASLEGAMGFMMFRLGAYQAGAMGILGLVLAIIGIYGVVSFGAAQRTREIGIRIALGAHPRAVLGLVLGQGFQLIVVGIGIGLIGAFGLERVLSRFIVIAHTSDALTFAGVTALLAGIATWACYLPARRATKIDPIAALRHE